MPKLIILFFISFFMIISNISLAQKKVIDLGDLSIEGDIRKPLLISIQSEEENLKTRKLLIEKEFSKIESELLSITAKGENNE
ncbi:MAG TPA: hypothetical protein PLJ21_12265 [Pseudobdellovibrionaceae bacterium]|nr:hypothetical protein [Pseudobdellovibrionaceae bacterium]